MLSKKEVNAFNGYPKEKIENVRIIENGDVRAKVQVTFGWGKSYAVITYTIPKKDTYVDINLKVFANDVNTMYKLKFDTTVDGDFVGQTAFGRENMLKGNKEVTFQKWCALSDSCKSFAVMNRGTYGGSSDKNVMNLSVMRTAVYSAHPIQDRKITEHDRWNEHIDMGENEFEYRLTTDMEHIDMQAEIYNNMPYAMSFFPPESEGIETKSISTDNRDLILTRFTDCGDDTLVRIYNSKDAEVHSVIKTSKDEHNVTFLPYEVKTFKLSDFSESEFIEI